MPIEEPVQVELPVEPEKVPKKKKIRNYDSDE
jgi:hypothetical protein